MVMAVRMRYPEQALEELRREDPQTPITLYFIRRLAASGKVPVTKIGRRRLINYDAMLEYLANPNMTEAEQQPDVVRRVSER